MIALIITNNPLIAIAGGLGIFALIYFTKNKNGANGNTNAYRTHPDSQVRPNMNSHSHGGGFSGGGGSFGGGGASGGW